MRINTYLTRMAGLLLVAATLAGCAGNAPRKPAATEKSAQTSALDDRCYDAYSRNLPPPAGCPADNSTSARNRRGAIVPRPEPLEVPVLPGLGLPENRPLLGR